MIVSTAFANSEKTTSTSSKPARTVMMSALGFVYLLAKTAPRTTVKVWTKVSSKHGRGNLKYSLSYIKSIFIRWGRGSLDLIDCAGKQLLSLTLIWEMLAALWSRGCKADILGNEGDGLEWEHRSGAVDSAFQALEGRTLAKSLRNERLLPRPHSAEVSFQVCLRRHRCSSLWIAPHRDEWPLVGTILDEPAG